MQDIIWTQQMTIKISADAIMTVTAAIMTQQVVIKLMQDIIWTQQMTIKISADAIMTVKAAIMTQQVVIKLMQDIDLDTTRDD
jgi:hypothetical protein